MGIPGKAISEQTIPANKVKVAVSLDSSQPSKTKEEVCSEETTRISLPVAADFSGLLHRTGMELLGAVDSLALPVILPSLQRGQVGDFSEIPTILRARVEVASSAQTLASLTKVQQEAFLVLIQDKMP